MKKNKSYVALPNRLIEDVNLHYTSKRVALALFAHAGRKSKIRKTVSALAAQSGCCTATVQQAIRELGDAGYITKETNYRYSQGLAMPVYAACEYTLNRSLSGGYTLIPRALLKVAVTPAAFCCLLYLYRKAGREGRAFPSLRTLARQLMIGKATVARALAVLVRLQEIVKRFCKTRNGDFSCNSYYPTRLVTKDRQPSNSRPLLQGDYTAKFPILQAPEVVSFLANVSLLTR